MNDTTTEPQRETVASSCSQRGVSRTGCRGRFPNNIVVRKLIAGRSRLGRIFCSPKYERSGFAYSSLCDAVSIRCAKLGNNSYTGPGAAGRRAMWRHRSKELKRELRYLNWRCQTSESWAGHSPRYPLHPLKASAFPHFFARLSFPEIGGRKEVAAISRLAQT
jgi:hypothetical protein